MPDNQSSSAAERVDLNDQAACDAWAKKLNVTHDQMREAVEAVGNNVSDVEMHLKGVRSTTNAERMEKAPTGDKPR